MSHQKKILIIEDEAPMLKILMAQLSAAGFEVITAEDGAAGYDIALREHPDLILLDLILPVMHGLAVLKKIREDKWGKTANIMILTNLSDKKRIAEALDMGVYEYLVKSSLDMTEVVARIKKNLDPK